MIAKYVVLNENKSMLMVLRPYQYHAVEAIVNKVLTTNKPGYIWHTTGSGKTLTSFKTAQILMQSPNVHKVVFVVDRKDLDFQTIKEFNSFSAGSVDATNNTKKLVTQFADETPLIVTTLQKLNTAISKNNYLASMTKLQNKRMVFIFDECHRSQFGETHRRIRDFFQNVQMFGFTGTPIFAENAASNALGKRTTNFSYQTNEEDSDADGFIEIDIPAPVGINDSQGVYQVENRHSREKLDDYITDYNKLFGSNFSMDNFYGYYKDIGKRARAREVDILLVVNMFLTGFDSQPLNKIYVDKNLKYHGLIQAYSRTNRIMGQRKSQGNVVCFRNLKPATDQAIELFANKDAIEDIILQPYEDYIKLFSEAIGHLLAITPTVESVDELSIEEDEARFIQAFREIIRLKNILEYFTEFSVDDLPIDEQVFADFRSKYLDLYDKIRSNREREEVSILNDIDFELELIHRDKINVSYIIALLRKLQDAKPADQEKQRHEIMAILDTETQLRSKKELIEHFISRNLPDISKGADIGEKFEAYWSAERQKAIEKLGHDEKLDIKVLQKVIEDYLFTEKTPQRDDVVEIMQQRPGLRERRTVTGRIIENIKVFVETFIDGVD